MLHAPFSRTSCGLVSHLPLAGLVFESLAKGEGAAGQEPGAAGKVHREGVLRGWVTCPWGHGVGSEKVKCLLAVAARGRDGAEVRGRSGSSDGPALLPRARPARRACLLSRARARGEQPPEPRPWPKGWRGTVLELSSVLGGPQGGS